MALLPVGEPSQRGNVSLGQVLVRRPLRRRRASSSTRWRASVGLGRDDTPFAPARGLRRCRCDRDDARTATSDGSAREDGVVLVSAWARRRCRRLAHVRRSNPAHRPERRRALRHLPARCRRSRSTAYSEVRRFRSP